MNNNDYAFLEALTGDLRSILIDSGIKEAEATEKAREMAEQCLARFKEHHLEPWEYEVWGDYQPEDDGDETPS